jgi:hypothetical protein
LFTFLIFYLALYLSLPLQRFHLQHIKCALNPV